MSDENRLANVEEPITDLTIIGEITPALERPKSIDPNDQTGKEGITQDEIRLPRLAIAQGLSPQLIPGEPKYIKGLTIGEMFNDISEEIYGSGPLIVVPCVRHVTRIEFDPNDKKVPIDRNVPPGDPRLEWHGNEPPRATEFYQFVSLIHHPNKSPEAIVVSIKATNKEMREAAELWTTYINARVGAIYAGMYKLTTKIIKGKNKEGQDTMYGVFIVKNYGYIPDTPDGVKLFAAAKQLHYKVEGKKISEPADDDIPI